MSMSVLGVTRALLRKDTGEATSVSARRHTSANQEEGPHLRMPAPRSQTFSLQSHEK